MPYPIRKTDFTWDIEHESRAQAWDRVKRHVQHELDRLQADHTRRRQIARRMATASYERNRQILCAFQQGTSIAELGRAHGLKAMRVREIIRTEMHRRRLHDLAGDRERAGRLRGSSRQFDVSPSGCVQAMAVITDP